MKKKLEKYSGKTVSETITGIKSDGKRNRIFVSGFSDDLESFLSDKMFPNFPGTEIDPYKSPLALLDSQVVKDVYVRYPKTTEYSYVSVYFILLEKPELAC